ncbi:MAG: hypothetical protein Q8R04_03590 [Nanoarchaeota archaeon]|nr:hypothetical protein [Nanoarchaeota archaeon]
MKKKIFDDINLTAVDFAVNAETGLLPLIKSYKIAEVPVKWEEM